MHPIRIAAAILIGTAPFAVAQDTTVAHGISAFGDLKYPAGFAHFDYVNPEAPKGGTMSFRGTGASATFDSLNQFILKGEPAQGLGLIYDTLMVRAYDEPDAVYGLIAESIEYPADRSWAVFTLREEARFADGEPLTAEDVVWTFETLKAEGHPFYRISLEGVASVEALSPTEVRITAAEGKPTRDVASEAAQVPILPKHYYETQPFGESTLEPPLGSGPYVVQEADAGRSVTYCRDDDYWAADLPVNIGALNFDCYRYEYFADTTAAFEAFKAGEYLLHEEFSSALWATNYEFPAIDRGWVLRDTLVDGRPAGTQGFWLNMRRPNLQDARVREALGMMFNFEWSNETLFYGLYERTDSFWEGSSLQAEGMPAGTELEFLERFRDRLPDEVFTEPAFTPNVNDAGRQIGRTALREAGALLDDAGWAVGDDGLRRKDGRTLEIAFLVDSPAFRRIVEPYIANLTRLGVDARMDIVDAAEAEERQENFDYDIIVARFVLSLSPSVELRGLYGSDSADQPGTFNLTGLKDPVVDEMIDLIIGASSAEEVAPRVKALDRVLRQKRIWVPNWYKNTHWIAHWDVFGRPDDKPPFARGVEYWWWDEDKAAALREAGALR